MNDKIYIISGPSSVGKSTFLQSTQASTEPNLPLKYDVIFPKTISKNTLSKCNRFCIHYNTLRVADYHFRNQDHQIDSPNNFASDPPWNILREFSVRSRAIVLLASRSVLKKGCYPGDTLKIKTLQVIHTVFILAVIGWKCLQG